MKFNTGLSLLVLACFNSSPTADTDKNNVSIIKISEHKKITLQITYIDMGTRSEGQIGRLFEEDHEIQGVNVGEERAIDGIQLKFYGNERPYSWSISGWNYADPNLIGNSFQATK